MKKFILSPSLLSCDFGRLGEELTALARAGIHWVHWDVMDGHFVPNITFGAPVISALRQDSTLFFDVHLMIEEPRRFIETFARAGADMLCVHAEATKHLERTCRAITDCGMQAGIALNPATPVETIRYLLPQVDMVLIMSVNPGFGGQQFIPFCLEKIRELAALRDRLNPDCHIQVDGGCTPENTPALIAAGANVLVSGSAFFAHPPYDMRYQVFCEAAASCTG